LILENLTDSPYANRSNLPVVGVRNLFRLSQLESGIYSECSGDALRPVLAHDAERLGGIPTRSVGTRNSGLQRQNLLESGIDSVLVIARNKFRTPTSKPAG